MHFDLHPGLQRKLQCASNARDACTRKRNVRTMHHAPRRAQMMLDLDRFHRDHMTIADLAHIARVDFSTAWRWVARGARPSSADARQRLKRRGLWRDVTDVTVTGRDNPDVTARHGVSDGVAP